LSLFFATVARTITVLGALLTFGVTRSVNFSFASVDPDAQNIPIIVKAASVKRVFIVLSFTNASDRPVETRELALRIL